MFVRLFQPLCVSPSNTPKDLQLRLNATVDIAKISNILQEFSFYFTREQPMCTFPEHVDLTQEEPMILI